MVVVVVVVDCRIVVVVEVVLVDGGTVVDAAEVGCIDAVLAVPSELSPEHAAVTSDAMTAMAIVVVPRGRRAGSAINGWRPILRCRFFTGPPVDRVHEVRPDISGTVVQYWDSEPVCFGMRLSAALRPATSSGEITGPA